MGNWQVNQKVQEIEKSHTNILDNVDRFLNQTTNKKENIDIIIDKIAQN